MQEQTQPRSERHQRHRDRNGEISRKHGNTLIRTLRKAYGESFAKGFGDDEKLEDVLHRLDEPSLSRLIHDHEHGALAAKLGPELGGGAQ